MIVQNSVINRILAIATPVVLCFVILLSQNISANAATAVTFKNIKLNSAKVNAGSSFNVEVTVDSGSVTIKGGEITWESARGRDIFVDLTLDPTTNRLVGTATVDNFAEPGTWKCVWASVYDADGNYYEAGDDALKTASILVQNERPDIVAPKFVSIKVSPRVVTPGGIVNVTVAAKDDLSGVDSGFIEWSTDQDSPQSIPCTLKYNAGKGVLEGTAVVPDEIEPAELSIDELDIDDVAGNSFSYMPYGQNEDGSDTKTVDEQDLDLANSSVTVKGTIPKQLIAPPVIISPTGTDQSPAVISDEDTKTAGIQFNVQGFAVPDYSVRLISDGKILAEAKADYDGVWRARVSVFAPLARLYAVAVLPNGLISPTYDSITRAQAAKLLAKLSGRELSGLYINAYTDLPASNPFVHYVESTKDLGFKDPQNPELFMPNSTISRGMFAGWVSNVYESVQENENASPAESSTSINNVNQTYKHYFDDVYRTSSFSAIIERGYENGWLNGNKDNTFHPDDPVAASTAITGIPKVVMADIAQNSWYAGYMFDLAAAGIISGSANNTYHPKELVTRGEFSKLLCALEKWQPLTNETDTSTSAISNHWAYPYMRTLQEKGAIVGISRDKLEPDKPITRAEAAKMAVLAGGYKTDTTLELNADLVGYPESQYILTAKKHGILYGYPDGLFWPNSTITRAEAAKIIWCMR